MRRRSAYSNCRVHNLVIELCEDNGHVMCIDYPKAPRQNIVIVRVETRNSDTLEYQFEKTKLGYEYAIRVNDIIANVTATQLENLARLHLGPKAKSEETTNAG